MSTPTLPPDQALVPPIDAGRPDLARLATLRRRLGTFTVVCAFAAAAIGALTVWAVIP